MALDITRLRDALDTEYAAVSNSYAADSNRSAIKTKLLYAVAKAVIEEINANYVPSVAAVVDSVFYIQDNGDGTKRAAFEASGISTATTRTFTFPNANGTLALTSDVSAAAAVAAADTAAAVTAASAALAAHVAAGDPHPAYLLEAAAASTYQPLDATLTALAGVSTSSGVMTYFSGVDTVSAISSVSFGRGLLSVSSASALRTLISLSSSDNPTFNAVALTQDLGVGQYVKGNPDSDTLWSWANADELTAYVGGQTALYMTEVAGLVSIGVNGSPVSSINSKLQVLGTASSSTAAAALALICSTDSYPVLFGMGYAHDSADLAWDAYYNGSWRASDASSFAIAKSGDRVLFRRSGASNTPGNALTWTSGMVLDLASGVLGINGHTSFGSTGGGSATFPQMACKRLTGTLDGSGVVQVAHGITTGYQRGVFVQGWWRGNSNEMKALTFDYLDGTNVRLTGGTASRPYRIAIWYTDSATAHAW